MVALFYSFFYKRVLSFAFSYVSYTSLAHFALLLIIMKKNITKRQKYHSVFAFLFNL